MFAVALEVRCRNIAATAPQARTIGHQQLAMIAHVRVAPERDTQYPALHHHLHTSRSKWSQAGPATHHPAHGIDHEPHLDPSSRLSDQARDQCPAYGVVA